MNDRQAQILRGVVRQYIRAARPVGSEQLARCMNVEISSATIRSALQELEEEGYLFQPHISAGRIPTDMGYRYFVDTEPEVTISDEQCENLAEEFKQLATEYQRATRTASQLLARMVQTVAVLSELESRSVHEAGLSALLEQPDEDIVEAVREASYVIDRADSDVAELANDTKDRSAVYIGEEIPFFNAQHTSIVVRHIDAGPHGPLVLLIVGPKRMAYGRNKALLDAVVDILQNKLL